VWLLQLDRIPLTLCVFKALTGLPCLTCGSTRVLGQLATGDVTGALWLNPLATVGVGALLLWALLDAVLVPSGRALVLEVRATALPALRWSVAAAALVNWAWLVAHGV
jgi:hypothetical protein